MIPWAALELVAAAVCLAAAATCVEPQARQERGWFGAFLGCGLLGLVCLGAGLAHAGVIR